MNLPVSASLLQLHVNVCKSLITHDWRCTVTDVGLLPVVTMDVAGTWLTSQAAYHSGSVGCCIAPCCDQLLSSSQYTRTFRIAASLGMLLIALATSLGRWYTRGEGLTYMRVLNFGHFLTAKEGRLICGSICTHVQYITVISGFWSQYPHHCNDGEIIQCQKSKQKNTANTKWNKHWDTVDI